MSIMDNLKELMDMSAVQEEDNPVFISRTGEFNLFSPKHKIRKNRKYGDTGVAYSEDGKTLEECPAIRPGRIRIHEGVERIGVNAFRNGRLSAIIMPDSIIELEYGAFMCSDVHDVKFGKNIRKIGDECFSSCNNISEITFPDSLEEIGELAFSPCMNLRNITFSKNLKVIGAGAFGSTSLKEVTIPSGSISIGNQAFCSAEHVIISDSIPKNFIFSIVLENDGYYNEERVLSDDYVKVTYKGNTAVLPRVIKRGELKKLNRDFESIIMGPNRKRLFLKAAHACEKQAAALAEYRLSRNPDAFSYMKKKCRDMAIRYIEEKTQEEFVEFLKLGTVSNKIIPELLSIASKKEKTIVVAYLMERLGKSNNTQEVFDKAIDDTFDL